MQGAVLLGLGKTRGLGEFSAAPPPDLLEWRVLQVELLPLVEVLIPEVPAWNFIWKQGLCN